MTGRHVETRGACVFLPTVIRPVPTPTAPGGPPAARLERPCVGLIAGRPGADPAEAVAALVAAWGRWADCAGPAAELGGPAGARLAALTRAPGARALPALERDLAAASRLWGADALDQAVAGAGSPGALVDRVTAALLARCGPAQLAAVEVAL